MSSNKKNTKITVTSESAALPPNVQDLVKKIQLQHGKCWCPEINPAFPGCAIEKDPKSVEAMMCLRVLTLDRERFIGWMTWYIAKMHDLSHLLTLDTAFEMLKLQQSKDEEQKQ